MNITKIKNMIPTSFKDFVSCNIPPFNSSRIYANPAVVKNRQSVSDIFLYRGGEFESVYVAENNMALLAGKYIELDHHFSFFDDMGIKIFEFSHKSNKLYEEINLSSYLDSSISLCTFIHDIQYSNDDFKSYSSGFIFQSRGYTGYRLKGSQSSVYSFVHGNFGGAFLDESLKTLARQRVLHTYTPQFVFEKGFTYELYFSNPTSIPLNISIKSESEPVNEQIRINKFGYSVVKIQPTKSYETLTWVSKLPLCRAIIFEVAENKTFDVFHS